MEPIEISIIVPVYNEEKSLFLLNEKIFESISKLNKKFEIIYINDGSKDESRKILEKIKQKYVCVKCFHFGLNQGKTKALDLGFKKAMGCKVLMIDSDLSFDPEDLLAVMESLKKYEVVISYRKDSERLKWDGVLKTLSSKIANAFRNFVLKEKFRDVGCPLKGFQSYCLKDLDLQNDLETFIPSLLKIRGYRIAEIPISFGPRKHGRSNYGIFNRVGKAWRGLFFVRALKGK